MKIGLLGGSFDPPHQGHRNISLAAINALGLDQIWWLVSPNNPLKKTQPWPLQKRLEQCQEMAAHPKIKVTGFECMRSHFFTIDSLHTLKCRYPSTRFVWVMGADNLGNMHHWYRWHDIFNLMPVLVVDRPGYRFQALSAKAGYFYQAERLQAHKIAKLATNHAPAWGLLALPLNFESSTHIRSDSKTTGTFQGAQ